MHCCCYLKRAKSHLIKPIANYAFHHSALRVQSSAPVRNNVKIRPVKRSDTLVRKHAVGDSKIVWKRVVLSNGNGSQIDSNVTSSPLVREAAPNEGAQEIAQQNSPGKEGIEHTIKPPDAPKPGIIRRHFAKVKGLPVDHETKDTRTSPLFKMYITHTTDPAPRITRIRRNSSNVITTHVTKEIKVRYFRGYGAFVRKQRTISNLKKRSRRLRYFDAVVLRAKTKLRDDKEFRRTESLSDGETDATSSQVKDRASKGSQRGWATRSPSRTEVVHAETEDDRLDRLQLQSLQHAIDDLTYAPPQKPVTFERLTMRQKLYRLRRRKFGSKSMEESSTLVPRSRGGEQREKD